MDKQEITYFVKYDDILIERRVGDEALLAKKIHPERCFANQHLAKNSLIEYHKAIREKADKNVKLAYLALWRPFKISKFEDGQQTTDKA